VKEHTTWRQWRKQLACTRSSIVLVTPSAVGFASPNCRSAPRRSHNNIQDTFYVLSGAIRILLSDPPEEVSLMPGQTYSVPPKRAHLVKNPGEFSAVFFVLQGIGEYDFFLATDGPHSE
jgi:mannose-6-phosphate isomerase-like protein (cupin superfamily)